MYKISKKLVKDATQVMRAWATKKGLLKEGRQLHLSMWIEDIPDVLITTSGRKPKDLDAMLCRSIESLRLSPRPACCISNNGSKIVGDLARTLEQELLKYRNIGNKSISEIKLKLEEIGLQLGMSIPLGPKEKQIVMNGPVRRIASWKGAQALEKAGFLTVSQFLGASHLAISEALAAEPEIGAHGSRFEIGTISDNLRRLHINW